MWTGDVVMSMLPLVSCCTARVFHGGHSSHGECNIRGVVGRDAFICKFLFEGKESLLII
jgi:hypothetical protein